MRSFHKELLACRPALWKYALFLTRDLQIAEELLQETMLLACAAEHTFKTHLSMKPWLNTIMLNEHRKGKATRRRRRDRRHNVAYDDRLRGVENQQQFHALALKETLEHVAKLAPSQREALRLTSIENYTSEEAGALMGKTPSNVRTKATMGRHRLREYELA